MKYLGLFMLVVVACILAALCFIIWRLEFAPSRFTVENISGIEIEQAEIVVDGQVFEVKNLKPSEKQTFKFYINHDSGYSIKVRFAGGNILEKRGGYVTGGYICDDKIDVDKDEILLVQKIAEY